MKNGAILTGALLFFPTVAPSQDPALTDFEKTIQLAKSGLPRVEALVPWLVVLVVGTIILGAASSILQAFNKPWVKPTTIVLGAIITLIGALKATFYAIDYATCAQTISDMEGIVAKAEDEIQNYERDGLPDSTRIQYLKQIEGNVDTLRKLDNLLRASGHAILPPGFIAVAYAQSQSRNPYATIRQEGRVIASTKTAGFEFAKYQALETVARERLKPPESQLDAVIEYLDQFAQPGTASCDFELPQKLGIGIHIVKPMFNCAYEVTLTSVYLNPNLIRTLGTQQAARSKVEVSGFGIFLDKPVAPGALTVLAAGNGTKFNARTSNLNKFSGFLFDLVPDPKTREWELVAIETTEEGRWSFEFSSAGRAAALLPVRRYGGKASMMATYQLTPPYPLHFSSEEKMVGVTGYRREPLATEK